MRLAAQDHSLGPVGGVPPPQLSHPNQDWGKDGYRLYMRNTRGRGKNEPCTCRAPVTKGITNTVVRAHKNVQLDLLKKGLIGTINPG